MKNIQQNKKIYSKPLVEVIVVDHEISLVMVTGPPGNGDGEPLPTGANMYTPQSGPAQVSSTSADNDPFGGSGPQY